MILIEAVGTNVMKRFLKWASLLCLALILVVISLPWFPVVADSFASKSHKAYLTENNVVLDMTKADGNFTFGDDFYDNRLFMLGEMHGYARVQSIDLALLTHLNDRLGVRYYMAEIDPATAIIFNYYLRTGDDDSLTTVFNIWHDERQSQWGNIEFLEKIRSIRDLNGALPDAQKISFIGVDGPSKQTFVEMAQALPGVDNGPADKMNRRLLGANAERGDTKSRYTHILSNIALLDEAFPNSKFYGLWGISHINKVGTNGSPSLSNYLNNGTEKISPTFEDAVATITTLCVNDCSNMMLSGILPGIPKPENGEPYTEIPMNFDNAWMFRTRGIGATKSVMGDAPNMMFYINNTGSPYMTPTALVGSSGYMSMIRDFQIDGSAAENFDALILMNGSNALTPIKGEAFVFTK